MVRRAHKPGTATVKQSTASTTRIAVMTTLNFRRRSGRASSCSTRFSSSSRSARSLSASPVSAMVPPRSVRVGEDTAMEPPTESPKPAPERGRAFVEAMRTRVTTTWDAVLAARPRIPALDAAFEVGERDRDVAGGLLAGAVAFRLFLWLVPFAVVAVTVLGLLVEDLHL